MAEFAGTAIRTPSADSQRRVLWLSGMTFAWMLVEAGIAVYAAVTARSAVLLAFGSDSVIELLSAAVVLLQWTPGFVLSERLAARIASLLLYALAGVVTVVASASWLWKVQPETSRSGILLTIAALVAMPVLATLKRREAARTGNRALAADATQSATCAYLALITLCGLSLRASLGIAWFDSLAALAAVPLLVREARSVARGEGCGCC